MNKREERGDDVLSRLSADNRKRLASLATASGRGEEELAADLLADVLEGAATCGETRNRQTGGTV